MRQGQKNNRMRGRGRKPSNPLTRSYDSNGPDVKIRGTANHIAEKYQSLARDALASGDIVMAENYYQHAEHYLRIIATAQANSRDQQGEQRDQRNQPSVNGSGEQPQASARPSRRPRSVPVDLAGEEQPDIEVVEIADVKPASVQDDAAHDGPESAPVLQEAEAADEANGEGEEEAPAPKRRRRAPAPRTPRSSTPRTPRTRRRAPAKNANEEAGDTPAVPAATLADAPQPVIAED
ncbi:MAG: DUF4167 domain-containing protein [Cohaesibacter sp.]|nr:DUF4167 domain-containing protein [Cohaesibacter sp.]